MVVRKYVIPLYEAAAKNMLSHGENYYWENEA